MKLLCFLLLLSFSATVAAQAPVEERTVQQKPRTEFQLKADFARREKEKAADRMHQAETELAEAQRAQQTAEKHLQETQQRVTDAQKGLAQAQANYQQAAARAAQTQSEVDRAWQK